MIVQHFLTWAFMDGCNSGLEPFDSVQEAMAKISAIKADALETGRAVAIRLNIDIKEGPSSWQASS